MTPKLTHSSHALVATLVACFISASPVIAGQTSLQSADPHASLINQPTPTSSLITVDSKDEANKAARIKEYQQKLQTAIDAEPTSAQANARMAAYLLTQNKTGESIPYFQEAIILDPENPKLFASLSIAYLHQSRYTMAKAMSDEALRLNPGMPQAKKLNEYIDAKQAVLEMAEKAASSGTLPLDGMHNPAGTSSPVPHN